MFKRERIKIIIYPVALFMILYLISGVGYYLLNFISNNNYKSILVSIFFVFFSLFFIIKNKLFFLSFNTEKIKDNFTLFLIPLFLLFIISNTLELNTEYSSNLSSKYSNNIVFYLLIYFPLRAIGEEILYRGFIQNYIDSKIDKYILGLSIGNITTSILMTIAHLGFLFIMPFYNAIFSILLVSLTSLILGIIYTKSNKNILVCILIHILLNFTHVFIHCFYSVFSFIVEFINTVSFLINRVLYCIFLV